MIVHRLLTLVLLTCVLGACREESPDARVDPAPDADRVERAASPAVVFVCTGADGERIALTTRMRADSVDVWLPVRFGQRHLALAMAGSDSSSTSFGDEESGVRIAGSRADFAVGGQNYTGCDEDRARSIWANARLRGVALRAVGNEPGWYLEITDGGQMQFVFDYGEREALVPTPEPDVDVASRVTVYHAVSADYDLLVEVEELACTDSMSGQEFSHTVTVEFEGRAFFGCGGRMTTFIGQV